MATILAFNYLSLSASENSAAYVFINSTRKQFIKKNNNSQFPLDVDTTSSKSNANLGNLCCKRSSGITIIILNGRNRKRCFQNQIPPVIHIRC